MTHKVAVSKRLEHLKLHQNSTYYVSFIVKMGIMKSIAVRKSVVISSVYRSCKKWNKHETRTEKKMRDFIKVDVLKKEYGLFIMNLVDHVDSMTLKKNVSKINWDKSKYIYQKNSLH